MTRRGRTHGALRAALALGALALCSVPGRAHATSSAALVEAITMERPPGWSAVVDVGGTVSVTDVQSVVGRDEGTSATLGLSVKGRTDWNGGPNEWRTILRSGQKFTKSTEIDRLSKSADSLALESLYVRHWWDWGGPYARLDLELPLFTGRAIEEDEETFVTIGRDGEVLDSVVADNLKLSDAFEPLELRPSIGALARTSLTEEGGRSAVLESLVGVGLRFTYADGVRVLDDDDDTDEIEVRPVEVFQQVGIAYILRLSGRLAEDTVGYQVGADAFLPFAHSTPEDGRELRDLELTSVLFTGLLEIRPLDWLAVEYEFRAKRDPQIINDWQLTNILSVKLGLSWTLDRDDIVP